MPHLLTEQQLDGMPSGLHNSGSRNSAILQPRNASTLYTSQTVRSPPEASGSSRLIREQRLHSSQERAVKKIFSSPSRLLVHAIQKQIRVTANMN